MAPIGLKLDTIAEVIHYIHLTKFQTDPTIIGETPLVVFQKCQKTILNQKLRRFTHFPKFPIDLTLRLL